MQYIRAKFDSLPDNLKIGGAAVIVALLLYAAGIKLVLLPVLVALNVLWLPAPRIFSSWLARTFVGCMITGVLLQVAATVQFLVAPRSTFVLLAVITALLHTLVWWLAPKPDNRKNQKNAAWSSMQTLLQRLWGRKDSATKPKIVDTNDLAALGVIIIFLLPFIPTLVGPKNIEHIAEIGSLQAIDATNHFAGIAEMTEAQHLNYAPGYYYPKGFHIAAGFMQNTVFNRQFDLGWRNDALLFFGQYMVLAAMLAYAVTYLSIGVLSGLRIKEKLQNNWRFKLLLALCVGPALTLFYLIPFLAQGFLNYYYVCATIIVGFLYVFELPQTKNDDAKELLKDPRRRWALLAYLLLIFGASVSWPLLIPPLVIIGALFLLPENGNIVSLGKSLWYWRAVPIALAFLLQLVPIYFQLHYSGANGSQGLNLTGGLKVFHPLLLLAGLAVLMAVLCSKQIEENLRHVLYNLFMPLFAFVGLLAAGQYFTAAEVRYYVIKTSLLLEILLLALFVALLLYVYVQRNPFTLKRMLFLPIVVPLGIVLLVGANANPLKDVRDTFRTASHAIKPEFLDHDVAKNVELGSKGDIQHFNSTVLHYNFEKQKFYAHSQAPFWANMMAYDSSRPDFEALHCNGALYSNLGFGTYSDAEQQTLIAKVKDCAQKAHSRNFTYYIVTDHASADIIRNQFGDVAMIVY